MGDGFYPSVVEDGLVPTPPLPATVRVWRHIERRGQDECWPWTGAHRVIPGFEYGTIFTKDNGKRKLRPAHVVAWESVNGPMPPGMYGLHSCDNPRCCNPNHVTPGTKRMNNEDRDRKGRHRPVRGVDHGKSVLTDAIVMECRRREASGETGAALAREFGVSQGSMHRAIRGISWRHIPIEAHP